MLPNFPWSVPNPRAVYRLRCSTERYPSRAASLISATVVSFCKSTNFFPPRPSTKPFGTTQIGSNDPSKADSTLGMSTLPSPVSPASFAARLPTSIPSRKQSAKPNVPFAAPADLSLCTDRPGVKLAHSSSNTGLPPDCA